MVPQQQGPPGPPGAAGGINQAELAAVLAESNAHIYAQIAGLAAQTNAQIAGLVAQTNAQIAGLAAQIAIVSAQAANDVIRRRNTRRLAHQAYIPLQREVAQVPGGGVAVGAVPAAAIPFHPGTEEELQAFSDHYGIGFDTWEDFYFYLRCV